MAVIVIKRRLLSFRVVLSKSGSNLKKKKEINPNKKKIQAREKKKISKTNTICTPNASVYAHAQSYSFPSQKPNF
jgi:hypothetical protein